MSARWRLETRQNEKRRNTKWSWYDPDEERDSKNHQRRADCSLNLSGCWLLLLLLLLTLLSSELELQL